MHVEEGVNTSLPVPHRTKMLLYKPLNVEYETSTARVSQSKQRREPLVDDAMKQRGIMGVVFTTIADENVPDIIC